MNWTIEAAVKALSSKSYPNLSGENELALELFDLETMCGIGVDGQGRCKGCVGVYVRCGNAWS